MQAIVPTTGKIQTLSCGQERYHQETNGARYVSPEQVHSLPKVQNDNRQNSQASDFQLGMDRYSGLEECLLARPDSSQVSTSARIQN